jgi:hypothetical protein
MEVNTQQTDGGNQSPVQAQPQQQEQVQKVETPAVTTGTQLPVGTSERTAEQFDKLKESNKKLYEANQLLQQELERKKGLEQQFQPVQQAIPQEQQPKIEQFIETDPVTGEQFVNEDRLKKAIGEAQSRATRAEQAVQSYIKQQQEREEQRQTEEAYKAYPELNPSHEKFDTDLTRKTRAFLLDSMVNPQEYSGRPLSFREAADLAKQAIGAPVASLAPQPKLEPKKDQENEIKMQASAETSGISSQTQEANQVPQEELEVLRDRSRRGDLWAVAKRLSQIEHAQQSPNKS